ncbi:MAG: hypothetical protein KDA36_11970, partial [Planctomycetaceae bacterium]|nr:hypothetical protein [Planctomycetaceae bacterium]
MAWDQFTGEAGTKVPTTIRGGSSAFSLKSENAFVPVENTQDAPRLIDRGANFHFSVPEDPNPATLEGIAVSAIPGTASPSNYTFSDVDPGTELGIAIVEVDDTNGTWQFSIDGGTSWSNIGPVSQSSARLLSFAPNTRLRFLPKPNYDKDTYLWFFAWDQTQGVNGGTAPIPAWSGTSAFSQGKAKLRAIVDPVNDPPTDLILTERTIEEFKPIGTRVGFLVGKDVDTVTNYHYSLVGGEGSEDNQYFKIISNGVTTNAVFEVRVKSMYSIRVRLTDNGGAYIERVFKIAVTNPATRSDTFGVYRDGAFYLDANRNRAWNGTTGGDAIFGFGLPTDIPITGDWNGDTLTDIGVYRNGIFYLDANGNRTWDGINGGDLTFRFGIAGDRPISGDWTGDGYDDIGVWRNGIFYLDLNANHQWDGTEGGDVRFGFGGVADTPITGDWNGDGKTEVG